MTPTSEWRFDDDEFGMSFLFEVPSDGDPVECGSDRPAAPDPSGLSPEATT